MTEESSTEATTGIDREDGSKLVEIGYVFSEGKQHAVESFKKNDIYSLLEIRHGTAFIWVDAWNVDLAIEVLVEDSEAHYYIFRHIHEDVP